MIGINGLKPVLPVGTGAKNAEGQKQVESFGEFLKEALNKVNSAQVEAQQLTQEYALGNDVELHQVIIATEKASLALQLTMQIRNKAIDAYQEIMRMQV
jgi:flagellar hook-basal body complex protein FliE